MSTLRFARDEADAAQLLAHLQATDTSFIPPLSHRLELAAYAEKLAARATRIEVWDGPVLAGCIAMYANDPDRGGFISNVSVLPSRQGQGLAGQLLERTLQLAIELGLKRIRLEVHNDNAPARALYRRHGFRAEPTPTDSPTLILERAL